MTAQATVHSPAQHGPDFGKAFKDALIAGIVALAIFGPLVGLETSQNMANELIVQNTLGNALIIVAIVFVGRFLLSAFVFPALASRRENRKPVSAVIADAEARRLRHKRLFRGGIVLLLLYPVIVVTLSGVQGSIKWVDNFGVQILIYVMLGWGLNIVIGLAGLLDLGYVAFYAVGAYSYALLAIHYDLSFWVLLPIAGILAATFGILLGFPVLRLRGDYLAIVTLAFGEIIRLVLINWREFTGGAAGISSIPKVTLFGLYTFDMGASSFARAFALPPSSAYYKIFLYYLILALALFTAFITVRLRRMPIGRAWEALREDEVACRSLGINTTNTKLTAFAIGAMFAGFAGSFFAARQGFVSPESFVFLESVVIVAIVVLGGMGSMVGVAIAAVVMIGGSEMLRELSFLKAVFGNEFNPDHYRMFIFGLVMVGIMLWRPRGFVSARQPTAFLKERKAISADLVTEGHG